MEISLITIKSPGNYGAVLQCFATFKYLQKLNFDTQVIDYYPREPIEAKRLLRQFIVKLLTAGRRSKINEFNKENIFYTNTHYQDFEELKKRPPISDIYIVGSDQVWNSHLFGGKLDPTFFLAFIRNKKKISYASSIGREDVVLSELKVMKEHLEEFSCISVREESAKRLLEGVGARNVRVVLDPVFLLKKEDYGKFIKPVKYKKYLLIYSHEKNAIIEKLIQEISKKTGLQVIEIGTLKPPKYSNNKYLRNIGVEDFLSLINYADFIVTSSLHGTAFSILFNKQFVSVEPSIRKTRLRNIMEIFEIEERLLSQKNQYRLDDLLKPIDYKKTNRLVDIEAEKSRNFLKSAVGFNDLKKSHE